MQEKKISSFILLCICNVHSLFYITRHAVLFCSILNLMWNSLCDDYTQQPVQSRASLPDYFCSTFHRPTHITGVDCDLRPTFLLHVSAGDYAHAHSLAHGCVWKHDHIHTGAKQSC